MNDLPKKFIENMKKQLPEDEWEAFFATYDLPPKKGLRVNTLKISPEEFEKRSPFALKKVVWEENGYSVEEEKLGGHPYHFAGLYYSQEPSAMCAAPLVEAEAGERVLDLCAAPGGKGTRLCEATKGEGIVVLNEFVFSRAKILLENVERMGIKNAVVLSESPARLAERFEGYFDKILVDAPCSGEGMFKKNADEAIGEWSEENVSMCAARQKEILAAAERMLKKGGRLVYSTCTFSEEEDEGQVRDFLASYPEMRLEKSEKLYPHRIEGEGHFAAVFTKDGEEPRRELPLCKARISSETEKIYRAFEKETLTERAERLYEAGGAVYALPEGMFEWGDLKLLRAGVKIGERKNGRFEPSHAFAMSLKGEAWRNPCRLELNDGRVNRFLRGESIECEGLENGWTGVLVDGFPIGWGKAVNGTVKNHIPKYLRKMG